MTFTLLEADEESDMGVYGAYLRAQTDDDLLDITRHLDPERYPARCDAAGRELRRRGMLHSPAYTSTEAMMRGFALIALALAVVTLALSVVLTPKDALGPSWPTGEMLPDGIKVTVVARLFIVAILRGIVFWGARFGLFTCLIALLGGWLLGQIRGLHRHRTRTDVLQLACLSVCVLLLAMLVAAGPHSAVPLIFDPAAGDASPWQRVLPLWDLFDTY